MSENALTRMQREIAALNRRMGSPLARRQDDKVDEQGYSPAAPAPPQEAEQTKKDMVTTDRAEPRAGLEDYMSKSYQPKIHALDLDIGCVITGHGKFPLEDQEKQLVIAVALAAMERHFGKLIEQTAREYGLWQNSAATPPQAGSTAAKEKPSTATNGVPTVLKKPRGRPRKSGETV